MTLEASLPLISCGDVFTTIMMLTYFFKFNKCTKRYTKSFVLFIFLCVFIHKVFLFVQYLLYL